MAHSGESTKTLLLFYFGAISGASGRKQRDIRQRKKQRPKLKILMILDKCFVLQIKTSKIFLVVKCWFYVSCKCLIFFNTK